MKKRVLLSISIFLLTTILLTGVCSANITLTGNTAGAPVSAPKNPCPDHGAPWRCCATLNPDTVQLITSPSQWFRDTLEAEYNTANWDFQYVGGNSNVNGKFDVNYYRAYNECPSLLGAEIKVDFVPDAGSTISDVLWIQTFRVTKKDGTTFSFVDDKTPPEGVSPPSVTNPMSGPFYPYQDEDTETGWQSSNQYDYFYDKPGFNCPCEDDWVGAYCEVYAAWLYGSYDASGNIIPMSGETKPTIWIHEGMGWGFQNTCVPEPSTLLLLVFGALVVVCRRVR